jgi:acyl-CoA thioester hydrolase
VSSGGGSGCPRLAKPLRKDYRTLVEETLNEAPGLSFVVRSVEIEFLKPAHMDDVLEILTTPIE